MVTKRKSRKKRRVSQAALGKPRGVIQERVRKVGPEHFGIVAVDCAKARSKWMLCDFYGKVLVPPTIVEHQKAQLQLATTQLREACEQHHILDHIVAVEMTGTYHRPVQRAFRKAGSETRLVHPFASRHFAGPNYNTLNKKVAALLTKDVRPITDHRSDLPSDLVSLVHRMLAKDPAQRPATASEVADALAPLAAGADLIQLASKLPPEKTTMSLQALAEPDAIQQGTDEYLSSSMTETHPGDLKKPVATSILLVENEAEQNNAEFAPTVEHLPPAKSAAQPTSPQPSAISSPRASPSPQPPPCVAARMSSSKCGTNRKLQAMAHQTRRFHLPVM